MSCLKYYRGMCTSRCYGDYALSCGSVRASLSPSSAQMVSNPHQFDVMLLPNLYGNIVSNVGAGLVGGAGVVSGMNVGWDYVVFEQGARHTFTSMAAQNVANPTGMLLGATDMLKQLGYGRV